MNLVLDIGNTRIKAATFSGEKLEQVAVYTDKQLFLKEEFSKAIQHCLVSSVLLDNSWLMPKLKQLEKVIWMRPALEIPIKNNYLSPETLGSDRLAAAVAASHFFREEFVLSVDTGTCIKYNFVQQGHFSGGAISPGLAMRLKAMHHFTSALPQVDLNVDYDKLIGQTTQESLLSGALMGAVAEVDGTIDRYREAFPGLTVVMSGGDTDFFVKRLKNSTFARPHLVLEGLNTILAYHVSQ